MSEANSELPIAWFLTGPPGIGKSTIVSKVVYGLRTNGRAVGGCLTEEVRSGRERTGFRLIDLMSGRQAELASSTSRLGPRVGRYRVNLSGLATIGATSLVAAARGADVIVVDEIGPMELTSSEFRKAAEGCLASGKPMLAVIHQKLKDPLIEQVKAMPRRVFIDVTLENRDQLSSTLTREILKLPDR